MPADTKPPFSLSGVTDLIERYCQNRLPYEKARANTLTQKEKNSSAAQRISFVAQLTELYTQFLQRVCTHAKRYKFRREGIQGVTALMEGDEEGNEDFLFEEHLPTVPRWIEVDQPLPTPIGEVSAFIFYQPEKEFHKWDQKPPRDHPFFRPLATRILSDYKWWVLEAIDNRGQPLLILRYRRDDSFKGVEWKLENPHLCAQCGYRPNKHKKLEFYTCQRCDQAQKYIQAWFLSAYEYIDQWQREKTRFRPPNRQKKHADYLSEIADLLQDNDVAPSPTPDQGDRQPGDAALSPTQENRPATTEQRPLTNSVAPPSPAGPVIVRSPLLLDRYIAAQRGNAAFHLLKAGGPGKAIEEAQKYLWMHSAWFMVEALRYNQEHEQPLRIPTDHIYIELEQPREMYQHQFAACSFLRITPEEQTRQRWKYSIIDMQGATQWLLYYEYDSIKQQGSWTVPKQYVCPTQQCQSETTEKGTAILLCESCQEVLFHYTSWITVALRMIAGEFQEVEMLEPEEVLETSSKQEVDEATGETKETPILHRFRVIRYYDACKSRDKQPQTTRGSWMSGKPLAESEYDMNPNAIIYVEIQPRDHDRTYKHLRYTNMRGKTQHIDPKSRLQPMTIATFQELPKIQRITRVYASEYADTA